jgi:sugar diacid utilization regulator
VLGLVQRIASSLDVDEILRETVHLVAALTGSAGALIYLLDEDTQRLWVRAGVAGYESWIGNFSLEMGVGLTGWTALNRAPAFVRDNAHEDPRYLLVPELRDETFQSALTYPLVSPSDRLVGVVTLHTEAPHEFTEDDITLVAPIASLCAAAVENAQLHAARSRQVDAVRALASAVSTDPRRGLHGLCEAARTLLGADAALVAVTDSRGRYTLGAVSGWRRAERVIDSLLLDGLSERVTLVSRARHPDLFETVAGARRGVALPLQAAGQTLGVLIAVGVHTSTAPAALDVASAIAATAAQLVLNTRLIDQLAGRNAERDFVEALIAGDEPEAVLHARARRLGCDLAATHVAVVFSPAQIADPEAAVVSLREQLLAAFPGSVCAVRGLEAAALVRLRDPRALASRVERLAAATTPIAVGISRSRTGVHGLTEAFAEAQQALVMGRALRGPAAVTHFEDLGVQRYLWSLAQEPARDVWQERLERLRLHDAEHGSRLFETVERYLECNANRKAAAAALFVHRNTLRQRFDRIRRVAQIDLDDTAVLFDLQVALRIVRFRELARP